MGRQNGLLDKAITVLGRSSCIIEGSYTGLYVHRFIQSYSHPPNKDLENQSDKKITLEQALPGPFNRDDTDPNHSHMK